MEAALTADGITLAARELLYEDIPYFDTASMPLALPVPGRLPRHYTKAKLVLKIREQGRVISKNDYEIVLADEAWANPVSGTEHIRYLADDFEAERILRRHSMQGTPCAGPEELDTEKDRLVVAKPLEKKRPKPFTASPRRAAEPSC